MLEQILHFKGTWRSYQQRVLDKYDRYSQDRKIHIVAAPGSGKTTDLYLLFRYFIRRNNFIMWVDPENKNKKETPQ